MNTALKFTIGAITGTGVIGGAVAVIYAFTSNSNNTKTVRQQIIAEGYTPFQENSGNWQEKFNKFRDGENNEKLKVALQEFKAGFNVTKNQENNQGGETLKTWCNDLLNKEKTKLSGHKTLDNAKLFCAEKNRT